MKTIEKIVYMTEKGQITLPVAWRRMVDTKAIRIKSSRGSLLEIAPVEQNTDKNTGWVSVFNAQRDNNGKGITSSKLLKVLGRNETLGKNS
jgi:bifunctional DNA-binding transcriptional regulator/antitoxin component of YhaV-PrlF toxin-antitoxin module